MLAAEAMRVIHSSQADAWPDSHVLLQAQAQALATSSVPDPDAATRLDLRHLPVVTIDSASTREVDDGLSVEERGEGLPPRLWVHIADPTRWLRPNTALDEEARRRAKSLYLPTGGHC